LLRFDFFAALTFLLNEFVVLIELALQQRKSFLGLNRIWTLGLIILVFV
jgi:hypothetical protein